MTLYVDAKLRKVLEGLGTDLRPVFIVSQFMLADLDQAPADAVRGEEVEGLAVAVAKAAGEKCERCWIYSADLNTDPAFPGTCPRCAAVLKS